MLSLALAQIRDRKNIRENFLNHIQFVKEAVSYGCNFILFPELSLSGYMQEEAKEKAQLIKKEDMSIFKRLAEENKISISIGLPLEKEDGIFICQKIFCKDGSIKCYRKRFLHPGEEKYYKSSYDSDWTITENSIRIANAICYDIENESHIDSAIKKSGLDIYAASICYSKEGISKGIKTLSKTAEEKQVNVAMANYVGKCWKMDCGGSSGIWDSQGNIVIAADGKTECMVLAEVDTSGWKNFKIQRRQR